MNKQKVSFDFDDTLDHQLVQDYAKFLILLGIEVHITTSRYEDVSKYTFKCSHDELFKVANELGIPSSQIHFTNFVNKAEWFILNPEYNFLWHLDDNRDELVNILHQCQIIPVNVERADWKHTCNDILNLNTED